MLENAVSVGSKNTAEPLSLQQMPSCELQEKRCLECQLWWACYKENDQKLTTYFSQQVYFKQ